MSGKLLSPLFMLFCLFSSSAHGEGNNEHVEHLLVDRVTEICSVLNLENLAFYIKVVDKNNGTLMGRTRILTKENISYDEIEINLQLLNALISDSFKRKVALDFCLAHEIGHVMSIDNLSDKALSSIYESYLTELDCDKIAGMAIALLYPADGSNILEQTLPLFLDASEPGTSHPPLMARIMTSKSGWLERKMFQGIDQHVYSRKYNTKLKKYNYELVNEAEEINILSNDRFLIEINTFDNNFLAYKIMDYSDESLSYITAKPKFKEIVNSEADDDLFPNLYQFGNDYSLYTNAIFFYKVIPGKEHQSTNIRFKQNGVTYTLVLGKNYKGNYFEFSDSIKMKQVITQQ